MTDKLDQELLARLADPFRPDQVRWKPQVVTDSGKALAVPYVDPRVVTERLDQVVGGDWSFHWEPLGVQGDRLVVKSSLTIRGVTREDVGEHVLSDREQADPWKSAVSDALKRAAVHFGVGRYLYWLEAVWCNYDRRRREFLDEPYIDEEGRVQVRRRRQPQERRAPQPAPARRESATRPTRSQGGPRRVRESPPSDEAAPPWAAEFFSWAARYLQHQGVPADDPEELYQRLAQEGRLSADLAGYQALSDAQGAFIHALQQHGNEKET
jgi:hypothetical protein